MDAAKTLIAALRSLLFALLFLPILFFACLLSLALFWASFEHRAPIILLSNRSAIVLLRIICGVKYEVHGELPEQGPYVALAKHSSNWETLFLPYYLYPVNVVLKQELMAVPLFGWSLSMMQPIPIDRGSPKTALRKVQLEGLQRLALGRNLLIFPEGTRVDHGHRGNYARSGANIAIQAKVPVVAIAHDAGKCWAGRSFIARPGTIRVSISEAMDTEGRDSRELTQAVENWIESRLS